MLASTRSLFFKILSLLATLPGVHAKPTVPIEIYSLSVFANDLKIFLGKKKKIRIQDF